MHLRFLAILTSLGVAAGSAIAAASPAPPAPPAKPAAAAAKPAAAPPAAVEPGKPTGKIVAVQPIFDAGTLDKGETIKHDFIVRNDGPVDLVISDARPSCGCTVASYDKKVAPGKTGTIHTEVETIDFAGPIQKTVTVFSNDAATPRLVLTIKAKIEPHIHATPGTARFIYVQTLKPGTITQSIWATDFDDLKITEVKSPYPFIKAIYREAKPEERRPEVKGKQWKVDVTIEPDAEIGVLREFLIVKTNHPKQPELRIPITGFVRPLMHVTPETADFGNVQLANGTKEIGLILVNFGEEKIQIKSVHTDLAGVQTKVDTTQEGYRFNILLTITDKTPKGAVNSMLRIETTSSKKPVIDVPLKGTIS